MENPKVVNFEKELIVRKGIRVYFIKQLDVNNPKEVKEGEANGHKPIANLRAVGKYQDANGIVYYLDKWSI